MMTPYEQVVREELEKFIVPMSYQSAVVCYFIKEYAAGQEAKGDTTTSCAAKIAEYLIRYKGHIGTALYYEEHQ